MSSSTQQFLNGTLKQVICKTYTLEGEIQNYEKQTNIPRSDKTIFEFLQLAHDIVYRVKWSYFNIYSEDIFVLSNTQSNIELTKHSIKLILENYTFTEQKYLIWKGCPVSKSKS